MVHAYSADLVDTVSDFGLPLLENNSSDFLETPSPLSGMILMQNISFSSVYVWKYYSPILVDLVNVDLKI